jgi:hypothetical protein
VDDEDLKLITLARASRARAEASEGAAVRDDTGRTYAAVTVDLPSLNLSALEAAVAMAVSSGARALEAAAVVSDLAGPADEAEELDQESGSGGLPVGLDAVRDIGRSATVYVAAMDGTVREIIEP